MHRPDTKREFERVELWEAIMPVFTNTNSLTLRDVYVSFFKKNDPICGLVTKKRMALLGK